VQGFGVLSAEQMTAVGGKGDFSHSYKSMKGFDTFAFIIRLHEIPDYLPFSA